MIPTLSVPDIRDYERINGELIQLLERGHQRIRLLGAERQRMLAFGLVGSWNALVEIIGRCGPEVGGEMDAPGLTVVCNGDVADGAGRAMKSGRLVIRGSAGDAIGIGQSGGVILVAGAAGHRAGLRQSGGSLHLGDSCGRLASERRVGGRILVHLTRVGLHFGLGATGGTVVDLDTEPTPPDLAALLPLLAPEPRSGE